MFDFSTNPNLLKADIIGLNECFTPVERAYDRGEIITICSSKNDTIGIIKSGTAYLSNNNTEEQRRIIDYYREGEMFGIHFPPDTDNKAFYVIAKTNCTIIFIKYKKLISCCEKACQKHKSLIDRLIMNSMQKQLAHIDILGQRTLRNKLLVFLEYIRTERNRNTFILPLPFSDLADYLAVDRSAMMREIKRLNEEGIISSDKRKITML